MVGYGGVYVYATCICDSMLGGETRFAQLDGLWAYPPTLSANTRGLVCKKEDTEMNAAVVNASEGEEMY